MWTGDYAKAIPLFKQALERPQFQVYVKDEYSRSRVKSLNQYLRARLALAYVMTEQPEMAQSLIQTLLSETYPESSVAQFVSVLAEQINNPFLACINAFDVFTRNDAPYAYGITIEQYSYRDNPYLICRKTLAATRLN